MLSNVNNVINSMHNIYSNFYSFSVAIEEKNALTSTKEYVKDESGNFVDVDTAISNYLKSDKGKKSVEELKNTVNNLKSEIQNIESNKEYLTEENLDAYNDNLAVYDMAMEMYDAFIKYTENPEDYASFKGKYEKMEETIKENEIYKD